MLDQIIRLFWLESSEIVSHKAKAKYLQPGATLLVPMYEADLMYCAKQNPHRVERNFQGIPKGSQHLRKRCGESVAAFSPQKAAVYHWSHILIGRPVRSADADREG